MVQNTYMYTSYTDDDSELWFGSATCLGSEQRIADCSFTEEEDPERCGTNNCCEPYSPLSFYEVECQGKTTDF